MAVSQAADPRPLQSLSIMWCQRVISEVSFKGSNEVAHKLRYDLSAAYNPIIKAWHVHR